MKECVWGVVYQILLIFPDLEAGEHAKTTAVVKPTLQYW